MLLGVAYCFFSTPRYTATAKIKVDRYQSILPGAGFEQALQQSSKEKQYFATIKKRLNSLKLADYILVDKSNPIIDQLHSELAKKSFIGKGFSWINSLISGQKEAVNLKNPKESFPTSSYQNNSRILEKYRRFVSIVPVRSTFLMNIHITTTDPRLSAAVADLHAKKFSELMQLERQESARNNLSFFEKQAAELANRLQVAEEDLAKYAEKNKLIAFRENEQSGENSRVSEISKLLIEATKNRIISEARSREAENGGETGGLAGGSETVGLRLEKEQAEAKLKELSSKFKSGYPSVNRLRAKVKSLEKALKQRELRIIASLRTTYLSDLEAEKNLQRELQEHEKEAHEASRKNVQYNTKKREYESLKDLHQLVLRQFTESQISSQKMGSSVQLADPAIVPSAKSSPNLMKTVLLSLLMGGGVGAALIGLAEASDRRFSGSRHAEVELEVATLGSLPFLPGNIIDDNLDPTGLHNIWLAEDTHSPSSEAIRSLMTSLVLRKGFSRSKPESFMITSAIQGEGKSTVSANLAVSFAEAGRRTVIIDADMRLPTAHKYFGIANKIGLRELLAGEAELSEVLVKVEEISGDLFIIPAGSLEDLSPSQLLVSAKLTRVIETLKQNFGHVIVDTAPILPVADSLVVGTICDGVIMVIDSGRTPREQTQEAVTRLRRTGSNVVGTVMNKVNQQLEFSSYYGGYHSSEVKLAVANYSE